MKYENEDTKYWPGQIQPSFPTSFGNLVDKRGFVFEDHGNTGLPLNQRYVDDDVTSLVNISCTGMVGSPMSVRVGSKWTVTLTGEQFFPSAEMEWTNENQEVIVNYRVTKINKVGATILITMSESICVDLAGSSMVDDFILTRFLLDAEFTVSANDGLLSDAHFVSNSARGAQAITNDVEIHRMP